MPEEAERDFLPGRLSRPRSKRRNAPRRRFLLELHEAAKHEWKTESCNNPDQKPSILDDYLYQSR